MSIVLNEESDAQLVLGTLAQRPRICKHALDEEAKAMQEEGCVSDE